MSLGQVGMSEMLFAPFGFHVGKGDFLSVVVQSQRRKRARRELCSRKASRLNDGVFQNVCNSRWSVWIERVFQPEDSPAGEKMDAVVLVAQVAVGGSMFFNEQELVER